MKKIARKSLYGLFLILLVTAMLLMMAGPLYAEGEENGGGPDKTLTINKIAPGATIGDTFDFEVWSWSAHLRLYHGIATVSIDAIDGGGIGTGSTQVTVHAGHPNVEALETAASAAGYVVTYSGTHEGPNPIITVTNTPTQTPDNYTLTYDGNGNTGGTIPAGSSSYVSGALVTVLGNTGSLTRNDGYIFDHWNTLSCGGGTSYSADATFNITENTTLYAQWIEGEQDIFTVTYDGNGSTGGTVPVDGGSYVSGAIVTVRDNTGSLVIDTGLVFSGWNTQADGSGTPYVPGATFNITADTTLFAVWAAPGPGVYNLWASTEGPGSITNPGLFVISPGQSLNYLMTPDGGASIADVRVNGVSVGTASSYTFVNVNSNQTIHAIFSGGGGAAAVTVAALTEEGTIEVLALTGNNMLFYIIGFALMAIGVAFGSFFISKNLRKREN